jgi:hypothetical protein
MGGHEIWRASMVAQEIAFERERALKARQQHLLAKAVDSGQISELSWFGGIKATARFLTDAVRLGISQRRITEAHS